MSFDLRRQPVTQLGMQGAHQPPQTVLTIFGRMRQILAADIGDRATDAEAFDDPIEALTWMNTLVKGDLYEWLNILPFYGLMRL